jgi:hypothetical protein
MRRLRVPLDARVEGVRRLILKLLLSGVNWLDLLALSKIDNRRPLSQRFQRDLRLQAGVNPASHLVRHHARRLSNGVATLQLDRQPQKRGPL